jgi:hypothetical protein
LHPGSALVALSFVSNSHADSSLTSEQLADGRLSDAGILETSAGNASDPDPNASSLQKDDLSRKVRSVPDMSDVPGCGALESAAAAHDLPLDFFTRLIRQVISIPKLSAAPEHKASPSLCPAPHVGADCLIHSSPPRLSRNRRTGFVNSATNSAIWDWQLRHIMQARDGSEIGSQGVADFRMKRELTSES